MDYSKIVPSRELCEEIARLGICQDNPELWWTKPRIIDNREKEFRLCKDNDGYEFAVVAPTLYRIMEEFKILVSPENGQIDAIISSVILYWLNGEGEKHLPNALAKALIAIRKDKNG